MDYKIDTITVIDAFKEDCECPLCKIKADMDAAYVSSCLGRRRNGAGTAR